MTTISEVFDVMGKRLNADKAQKINKSYLFAIGGEGGGKWKVDLTKGDDWITPNYDGDDADCVVTVDNGDDWVAICSGKMNPTMAFMTGKVKVKGDMGLAMKLQTIIG